MKLAESQGIAGSGIRQFLTERNCNYYNSLFPFYNLDDPDSSSLIF